MKQPCIFIDIDGTLLHHFEKGASRQWYGDSAPVAGAKELLDSLEGAGFHIVLTTGRAEVVRAETEAQLAFRKLVYHQLVMGIGSGPRYLINDAKPSSQGQPTAFAATVPRNAMKVKEVTDWIFEGDWK